MIARKARQILETEFADLLLKGTDRRPDGVSAQQNRRTDQFIYN